MVFDGSTSSTAVSETYNIESDIISYSIANKSGGAITAKVGLVYGSAITYILYDEALSSGETFIYPGERIRLRPNYRIFVEVSGSADFYFTLE